MNDFTAKASSSLAITEKRAQRPGGCAGIFFQLFDWNRRFAKKKLFPKKLLPLARGKQVAKKFNADEKLPKPKHLLISDDNGGGFPIMKKNTNRGADKEQKHEMKAPGLVARLMGLESMPAVQQDRLNEGGQHGEKGGIVSSLDKEDLILEKGSGKYELRPEKIQKTGLSERRPVTKFGADALQIKNVLSRSRKHHPRLASPVKSPRIGRSTSRLIDAATRILEPGLQARNRTKCSLTYSSSVIQPLQDEVMTEAESVMGLPTQSNCSESRPVYLKGQTSCRSCGNLLQATDLRLESGERAPNFDLPASNVRDIFFKDVEQCNARPATCVEKEEVVLLTSTYPRDCLPAQAMANVSAQFEAIIHGMDPSCSGPVQRHFPSCSDIHQNGASSSIALKNRVPMQSQMLTRGDRVPPNYRFTNGQPRRSPSVVNSVTHRKDFAVLNYNMNQTPLKASSKLDNISEAERKYCRRRDDSSSTQRNPVRKRRNSTVTRQDGGLSSSSPITEQQRSTKNKILSASRQRFTANPVNHSCLKSRASSQEGNRTNGTKGVDVVSFTFGSPVKSKVGTLYPKEMDEKKTGQIPFVNDNYSQQKLMAEGICSKETSEKSLLMNEDALGALLEQKLKELTCQAEDESAAGPVTSGRTTASILQELIAALTAARPTSQAVINESDVKDKLQSHHGVMDTASQAKSRTKRSSVGVSHDSNNFSPGSVLEASFSNESCISSSMDDGSGNVLQSDCINISNDKPPSVYTEPDLSDSASSVNNKRFSHVTVVTDLLNHISTAIENFNLAPTRSTGIMVDHIREVILRAELLFGKRGQHNAHTFVDFLLGAFLDELESLAIAAWKNTVILGFEVIKGENHLKGFLFDCIIECLDQKYCRYCNFGFNTWSRLPTQMNSELLVEAFDEEVRKWASLAGKTVDEMINWEMSTSVGKWTDFEIEGFETGAEINQAIVQTLIDEVVIDLLRE
ncbi:hypothetical protein Ancab_034767 [Ancistrocladus abbreviatus]